MDKELTADLARKLIEYDEGTGVAKWRPRPPSMFKTPRAYGTWNSRYSGEVIGTGNRGEITISIHKKLYRLHRVLWLLIYGEWPTGVIDHIDGDFTNNRKENLRCVDQITNSKNRRKSSNNSSGFNGIHFNSERRKWVAQGYVTEDGKERTIPLGRFKLLEDAVKARQDWQDSQVGYTDRHGK